MMPLIHKIAPRATLRATVHTFLHDRGSVRELPFWLWTRYVPGRSPLRDGLPWMTFSAIHWLKAHIKPNFRVFEWGSGGSTLFFSQRVASVVSVEHDAQWYAHVKTELAKRGVSNCEYILKQAATGYQPERDLENADFFQDYVGAIDGFADGSFDLVIVDGSARVACAKRALSKLRKGGYLLLDNSDRAFYGEVYQMLADYQRFNFNGIVPHTKRLSTTSVWKVG